MGEELEEDYPSSSGQSFHPLHHDERIRALGHSIANLIKQTWDRAMVAMLLKTDLLKRRGTNQYYFFVSACPQLQYGHRIIINTLMIIPLKATCSNSASLCVHPSKAIHICGNVREPLQHESCNIRYQSHYCSPQSCEVHQPISRIPYYNKIMVHKNLGLGQDDTTKTLQERGH